MIVFGSGGGWQRVVEEMMDILRLILRYMGLDGALIAAEMILMMIVSLISSILVLYLSITIGSTVARRHKVLASVGVFFGIQFVLSIVTTLIGLIPSMYLAASVSADVLSSSWTVHLTAGINLIIQAAVAVGSYLICHAILNRRLNLS